jgi:hypothetical protein
MELSSYLATFFYNYFRGTPFSTYGDLVAATIQNLVIIGLIWVWGVDKKQFTSFHIFIAIFLLGSFISVVMNVPSDMYHFIATYGIVVITLSRLPQIYSNFMTGKVGVQSPITLVNAVLGAAAKVFITSIETNDIYLIIGSVFGLVLNVILFSQVLYMSTTSPQVDKKTKSKAE